MTHNGCAICTHAKVDQINEQLFAFNYQTLADGQEPITLNSIAAEFGVRVMDLQVHAFMHLSQPTSDTETATATTTLVQEAKVEELAHMRDAMLDYKATLLKTGKMLRERVSAEGANTVIPKGSVELYLGAGNNMRQIVNDMLDANMRINGEGDDGLKAIAGVVAAIKRS